MSDVKPKDETSKGCVRLERTLLILTFICTAFATIYSEFRGHHTKLLPFSPLFLLRVL